MTCKSCRDTLETDRIEGLPAPLRAEVEGHVASCPACREFLAQNERLRGAFDALSTLACPDETLEQILRIPAADRKKVRAVPRLRQMVVEFVCQAWRRPAIAWGMGLLLLAGGYLLMQELNSPPVPQYTQAELLQKKQEVDLAFSVLFAAIKKTENMTREKVIREGIIEPARKSLDYVQNPSKERGDI